MPTTLPNLALSARGNFTYTSAPSATASGSHSDMRRPPKRFMPSTVKMKRKIMMSSRSQPVAEAVSPNTLICA